MLLLVLLPSEALFASSFVTRKGQVRPLGTSPLRQLFFITEEGESLLLEGSYLEELQRIPYTTLLLTGKQQGQRLLVMVYDVVFDKKTLESEEGEVLGRLYSLGTEVFLIGQDNYVIKVNDLAMMAFVQEKVYIRGHYRLLDDFQGEITPKGFIRLQP